MVFGSSNRFKCNYCGKYISMNDLNSGKAYVKMIIPDSHFTAEEFETVCKKCKK